MKIKPFVSEYITRLKLVLDDIDPNVISEIVAALEKTIEKKSRIYILGNGGSSATASHMVNDLGAGLRRRDIINFDVVSLSDNSPVITAIVNDIGYENKVRESKKSYDDFAIIVHAFYPEVFIDIIDMIAGIEGDFKLFVTVPIEKENDILSILQTVNYEL